MKPRCATPGELGAAAAKRVWPAVTPGARQGAGRPVGCLDAMFIPAYINAHRGDLAALSAALSCAAQSIQANETSHLAWVP